MGIEIQTTNKQWKERGTGNMKLKRCKATRRVRFLMRTDKMMRPCANFLRKKQNLVNIVK